MGVSNYNPHWDHLAGTGQNDRLAGEIHLWRDQFLQSLQSFADRSTEEWREAAEPLLEELSELAPLELTKNWSESRELLSNLNQDGFLLREDYLQQCGPTPLAYLNSVVLQLEALAQSPASVASCGAAIFADLKSFEAWAQESGVLGPAYEELRNWLEELGLGLLSKKYPTPDQARAQISSLWEKLGREHEQKSSEQALAGPTESARWNSWILMLELCEHETQDHGPVLHSLDGLDGDVEEVAASLGEDGEAGEIIADYRDASRQLRQALVQGKRLKGWSQILPPILTELDRLVPREPPALTPVSQVRSLCQEFESGCFSTEQFHNRLLQFQAGLVESRKQARIQTAQHPDESTFLEALGKLESGLDILQGVDRAGQASRLEMGCTLIEEGLSQIQKLENKDG